MSGKTYIILIALAALLAYGAPVTYLEGGSPVDQNWGRSFEEQKYSQIIDHEAGKNLIPLSVWMGLRPSTRSRVTRTPSKESKRTKL